MKNIFAPFKGLGLKSKLSDQQVKDLEFRRRGRSTGLALKAIGLAMLQPGAEIEIRDHYDQRVGHENLKQIIRHVLRDLNLEGFTINEKNTTLTFNLDMTVD